MITVIIATRNRHSQLNQCLVSLGASTYRNFNVIIACRGTCRNLSRRQYPSLPLFTIVPVLRGGKSAALNEGIRHAKGDIIAFTDDDCIVNKNWLRSLHKTFKENRQVGGVFGKTTPYQPNKNKGKTCPCTFKKTQKRLITKPCYHADHIGFGNNMAFRKKVLNQIGGFKNWLGPGSVGSNAEDAEFALRALIKGYKLLYDPSVIVYHNKWLTNQHMKRQELSYACGELACYGYFLFQGHQFARPLIANNIQNSFFKIKNSIKKILFLQWSTLLMTETYDAYVEIFWRGRGLTIGFISSLVNPIQ